MRWKLDLRHHFEKWVCCTNEVALGSSWVAYRGKGASNYWTKNSIYQVPFSYWTLHGITESALDWVETWALLWEGGPSNCNWWVTQTVLTGLTRVMAFVLCIRTVTSTWHSFFSCFHFALASLTLWRGRVGSGVQYYPGTYIRAQRVIWAWSTYDVIGV